MKLEDIFLEWSNDSKIDRTDLSNAALIIAKLHHKYYEMLSRERLLYYKIEAQVKELKRDKFEFYVDGPTQEQIDMGWELPAKGRILKSDVNMYLESDKHIIELNLKLAYQKEKLDVLESIIRTLHNRGFHIKSAIDYERLQMGAG